MKRVYGLITLFIILAMLLPVIVSCDGGDEEVTKPAGDTTTTIQSVSDSEVSTSPYESELDATDYGKKTFTILERELNAGANIYYEMNAPKINGDIINDALFKRNSLIEQKYNIILNPVVMANADMKTAVENMVKLQDHDYDAIMAYGGHTMYYSTNGLVIDMNSLDYVDFENDWWYTEIMDDTKINGKNTFAIGDICTASYTATVVIFYNPSLGEKYNVEDCYKLVIDHKWTFEKFLEVGTACTVDLDGGGMGVDDQYTVAAADWAWQPYFYGQGYKILSTDSSGNPTMTTLGEAEYDAIKSIIKLVNSDNCWYLAKYPDAGTTKVFREGRALFWGQLMVGAGQIRNAPFDFGILPLPMRNEDQEEYISYMHTKTSLISVPSTNEDMEMTGRLLEDICYFSYKLVKPQYFDVLFDGIIARDEQTVKMLDIVYSNVFMDLVQPLGGVGLTVDTTIRNLLTFNLSSAVNSAWQRMANENKTVIDKTIEAYEKLE